MNDEKLDEYLKKNREMWNGLVSIHEKSKFYDVQGFKQGRSSLTFIELDELRNVTGKSLLHLQCHFGLDTLSWARLGAQVTGVDFSEKAIQLATSLAKELSINAHFIHSNIYDLPGLLDEQFDIVYTSYGVLCWLPDLKKWGKVISHFLKRDGTFYMLEFHPIRNMFGDDGNIREPYFHSEEPAKYEGSGSYAEPRATFTHISYEWSHSLSDIVNALIEAGLRIEFLHEFPFCTCGDLPFLEQRKDSLWYHKNKEIKMPLMFSIKASKSAQVDF